MTEQSKANLAKLQLANAAVREASRVLNEALADGREISYSIVPGYAEHPGPGGWSESYLDGSCEIAIKIGKGSQEYQAKQKEKIEHMLRPA